MKSIFTCLFIGVALFVSAQQSTFKKQVLSPGLIDLYQVTQLSDGSFVGVGYIYLTADFSRYITYLLKTDVAGNVLASKSLESPNESSSGTSIAKTSDGGFIISGSSDSGAIELIKFKADLTISWQKTYSIANADQSGTTGTVLQTPDGGYMVTNSINRYTNDASETAGTCLLKTDASGNVLLAKQYFNGADWLIYDIAATTDGNYAMLAGNDQTQDSAFLIKIDAQGNILWSRAMLENAQAETYLLDLLASSDGGIVIAGELQDDGNRTGDDKLMMVKYNNAGVLQWTKKIASGRNTATYSATVTEDSDGGYVFAGGLERYRGNGDTSYAYAAKTDRNGNLLWTRAFDRNTEDGYADISYIIRTSDGGFAVCGSGNFSNPTSDNPEGYDNGCFLYKITADGQVCNEISDNAGSLEQGVKEAATSVFTSTFQASASNINVVLNDAGVVKNVCSSSPVFPIQLLSFNATLQNKNVNINWQTASEINTGYFMVERSANGLSFTTLQKIAAKGNSSVTQTYSTADLQPLQGTSYYRLKQVDKDGETTYSSIATVTVLSYGAIVISPNPVGSTVHIIIQSTANSNLTLQVSDMRGNVLATQVRAVTTERNEISIPAASLAKGVYVLKVMDKGSVQTVRFIKE